MYKYAISGGVDWIFVSKKSQTVARTGVFALKMLFSVESTLLSQNTTVLFKNSTVVFSKSHVLFCIFMQFWAFPGVFRIIFTPFSPHT